MRTLLALILAVMVWPLFGADTYSTVGLGNGSQEITVTTSAVVTVTVTTDTYTVVHLNLQNDGSTASVSTDVVFIQGKVNSAGTAIAMAPTHADGTKLPLLAGAAATLSGRDVPPNSDGTRTIQLQALGHGAKVLIKREQ